MANPTFGEWLRNQLTYRHWSQSELVRRAELSSGTVSNWILEKRIPDPISCESIAIAMGIPLVEVLNAAGYPVEEEDARRIDIADDQITAIAMFAINKLSPSGKQRLIANLQSSLETHFADARRGPDEEVPHAARQRDGRRQ